jgi:isoleucyl-tRNA synthetase
MSKSKKNYPDPTFIADKFGADACRLYICNSPVMRAEPFKFAQEGVKGVVRDIFLPWFNAHRFLSKTSSVGKNAQRNNLNLTLSLSIM